jgi:hypothetical protein
MIRPSLPRLSTLDIAVDLLLEVSRRGWTPPTAIGGGSPLLVQDDVEGVYGADD